MYSFHVAFFYALLDASIFLKFVSSECWSEHSSGWCFFICGVECSKDCILWRPEQKQYRVHTVDTPMPITAKFMYLVLSESVTGLKKEFNWLSETSEMACQILPLIFEAPFWCLKSLLY